MNDWLPNLTYLAWQVMPYYVILSVAIFSVGVISLILRWFSRPVKEPKMEAREIAKLSFGAKSKVVLTTIFGFWVGSIQVFKRSKVRWIMHISIFLGAIGLVIFHAIVQVIILPVFGLTEEDIWFPGAPLWVRIFFHNLFFFLLLFGATIALIRRLFLRKMRIVRNAYNLLPLVLIFLIGFAGLFAGQFSLIAVSPELQSFFLLLHAIIVYTTIAYLPYGKFVHLIATPMILLKRSVDDRMKEEWYRQFGGGA